jgi:hypothetical protein
MVVDMLNSLWPEMLARLGGYAFLAISIVGATWAAFKSLSGKWLDSRFAERLKKIDQDHDVMVRRLQSSIDREFQRALKLHTAEFDTLSECWSSLHTAYWLTRQATSRSYQLANLSAMTDGQLEEFIHNLDFPNWRKAELRELDDPNERQRNYLQAIREKEYSDSFNRRMDLTMLIDRKGIYMQPEVRFLFETLSRLIADAQTEALVRLQTTGTARRDQQNEFLRSDALRDGESIYHELETLIHARLWSSTLMESSSIGGAST